MQVLSGCLVMGAVVASLLGATGGGVVGFLVVRAMFDRWPALAAHHSPSGLYWFLVPPLAGLTAIIAAGAAYAGLCVAAGSLVD